jgi:hypothetical protein
MSKVDTLKAAIDYIRYLQDLVDEHDAVSAVLDGNSVYKLSFHKVLFTLCFMYKFTKLKQDKKNK